MHATVANRREELPLHCVIACVGRMSELGHSDLSVRLKHGRSGLEQMTPNSNGAAGLVNGARVRVSRHRRQKLAR